MASTVTIVLPTFNRASFLPEAFASIQGQSCQDWELVVVDDGSTDATRQIVEEWTRRVPQPVSYVWQENRGAYGARNTGLRHVRTPFVAFFDSDDLWLPHHLERSLAGLAGSPAVDWVFAACRMVDPSGNVVERSTFLDANDQPRPFLSLRADKQDGLHIIRDPHAIECMLTSGIYCGLQNSVIRSKVFEHDTFWEDYRVVEDSLYLVRALARGVCLAYLTDVHVIYRMHDSNSSGSAVGANRAQLRRISEEKVRGLERLKKEVRLRDRQLEALNRNLAREYFWHLGYSSCWLAGETAAGLEAMREALRLTPFDTKMLKTYLACLTRAKLRGAPSASR
jgi:glycosyltransferase involved in cell wall biosynthesis